MLKESIASQIGGHITNLLVMVTNKKLEVSKEKAHVGDAVVRSGLPA